MQVKVRTAMGMPLSGSAMVRIFAATGSMDRREPTQEGGEVVFRQLPFGNYIIEVDAPGFDRTEDSAEVVPGSTAYVYVTMRPEGSGKPGPQPPSGTVLSPKARKEVDKAVEELNAGKLKESRERLEKVAKSAAGHPEPHYLLAVVLFRERNIAAAEEKVNVALRIQPKNPMANALLGRIHLQQGNPAGAIKALEIALAEDPNVPESHALLASAAMQHKEYEKARTHAAIALTQAEDRMPHLRLLVAEALLQLGEKEKATAEVEKFLAAHAAHAAAPNARAMLARLRTPELAPAAARPAPAPAVVLPPPPAKVVEGNWAPPDIDELKPMVAPDVTCSLPDVMKNVGRRVQQLAENLQGVSASELVEYSELDEAGTAKSVLSREFQYMVSIEKLGRGLLAVEEMRNGRQGYDSFPTQTVTRGLAALALIFYPEYAKDLDFRCDGLGQWKGQSVWQLYFKQRPDRENRIRSLHNRLGRFSVPLKGRVWVAANSHQILRLETDLVAPIAAAELEREHITVEYQPVDFKQRKLKLWLPQSAEMYAKLQGKRFRQRHQFTNFTYFSVDTRQKIEDPKELDEKPPR